MIHNMSSCKLDFDCSNDAATAATVRSSRRKHTKVKKQSSCSGSVSKNSVNSTANTTGFVFNASNSASVEFRANGKWCEQQSAGEFLDSNMTQFTMGATDISKLYKTINSEVVQNNGNMFQLPNSNFVFGVGGKAYASKVSKSDSNEFEKPNGTDFVFGAKMNNGVNSSNIGHDSRSGSEADPHLVNSLAGLNLGTSRPGDVKPLNDTPDNRKFETRDFVFSATGNQNDKESTFKGTKEFKDETNNLKSEGARSNTDKGNYNFVFGSNLSNETKTTNIHEPTKVSTANKINDSNNFSFEAKLGGFGTSFTGFNTPDINLSTSFTSDMFPGLGKKLEFSKTNTVTQRKLKKTKKKLMQQIGGHANLSKKAQQQSFEESSGCSPMDVSPYGVNEDNLSSSSATSFTNADVASRQRPNQKKYKLKTGRDSEFITPKSRANVSLAKASDHEICDKWRKRGNQAYKNGDLSEAEVCYTKGISSIQHDVTAGVCIEPLLLCYSNRAAARMALGRMREGLEDCRMTAALDPNFVKANLRSANCHLLLGELQEACYNYNKCLEFDIVLDRRIAIEAADGLQKANKVIDYLKQSAELLQQKTYESATTALGIIADALSISCYSEKLLNMKGDALLMLGKHKEVVELCEQTLESAEKNFAINSLKLWRWKLMSKSYFHLGRLELALELIEKHEQLRPNTDKNMGSEESLAPLSVTIRELLHCKNAGNEAFQRGKHTEAVEHYSGAISKSTESHSFAAVCFCNCAAAHQSLGEISNAIGDCSIAIALDGTYQKALSRRATLWEMIRDYKHAADDLQTLISVLEIGRSVTGSGKDLRRARKRLSSVEENAKKERSLNLYLILGIKCSDAAVEVKKAYRKAALRHHPDKAGQVFPRAESGCDAHQWKLISESIQRDAGILFKMIGEAYAVLSDSTKRSKYDHDEEMWDDRNINSGGCSMNRKASDFYTSPFETSNPRNSHDARKTYGNSSYYYWEHMRKSHSGTYSRW